MKILQLTEEVPNSILSNDEDDRWGGHSATLRGLEPCGRDGSNGGKICPACNGTDFLELPVKHIVRDTTTVLRPDGRILMIYIKDCIPRNLCELAFRVLKQVPIEGAGDNRGLAAGIMRDEDDDKINRSHGSFGKMSGRGARYHTQKQDGTMSRTTYAASVNSAVVGYMDRYPRIPYCRQTAFNINQPELWTELLPYIQSVSSLFQQYAPEQWNAQHEFIEQVHPDFRIPTSIFTTLTVNRNFKTYLHQDAGDFRSGLGCMSALQGGDYAGAELIFPKYQCAVDMRTGGVCLADVHQWHGNDERSGLLGHHVRFSCVFYARQKMIECGSNEYELQRAREFGDNIAERHADMASQKQIPGFE